MPKKASPGQYGLAVESLRPYVLPTLVTAFVLLAGLLALYRWERFLGEDRRFVLRPGAFLGDPSPDLRITGLNRTPPAAVRAVFAEDIGRSVYLIPLNERREALLAVPWVKDAAVTRLWPSRLHVRIEERTPVAFVQIDPARPGGTPRVELIDSDGQLLPVMDRRRDELPILTGIRERLHTPGDRAERVRMLMRFFQVLGKLGEPIEEVDIADTRNLKAMYPTRYGAIQLYLGNERWLERIQYFLEHLREIEESRPFPGAIDLRHEDWMVGIPREAK